MVIWESCMDCDYRVIAFVEGVPFQPVSGLRACPKCGAFRVVRWAG